MRYANTTVGSGDWAGWQGQRSSPPSSGARRHARLAGSAAGPGRRPPKKKLDRHAGCAYAVGERREWSRLENAEDLMSMFPKAASGQAPASPRFTWWSAIIETLAELIGGAR
jgi:hypothetical protein